MRNFDGNLPNQANLPFENLPGQMGEFSQDQKLRFSITQAIRQSKLSREEIADRLSYLVGEKITEKMLYDITAESMKQHRVPALWIAVLGLVLNDHRGLKTLCEIVGGAFISKEERVFIDLGRAAAEKEKAAGREAALKALAIDKI